MDFSSAGSRAKPRRKFPEVVRDPADAGDDISKMVAIQCFPFPSSFFVSQQPGQGNSLRSGKLRSEFREGFSTGELDGGGGEEIAPVEGVARQRNANSLGKNFNRMKLGKPFH